jgi:hypothetical protein
MSSHVRNRVSNRQDLLITPEIMQGVRGSNLLTSTTQLLEKSRSFGFDERAVNGVLWLRG